MLALVGMLPSRRPLRIIYVSKAIPGAGVYLSPLLSNTDRQLILDALINALQRLKQRLTMVMVKYPTMMNSEKIISRTEQILSCSSFNIIDLKKQLICFVRIQLKTLML